MHKLWIVARHEYKKAVARRAFLLSTLGIPLLIVIVMGVAILTATGGQDERPAGYVDEAGVLSPGILPAPEDPGQGSLLRAFADEAGARAALEDEQIQAYFLVPAGYLQSHQVEVYYLSKTPSQRVYREIEALIKANLLAGVEPAVRQRLMDGLDLTLRSVDGRREVSGRDFTSFLVPFVVGFFFMFAVMMSAGYLLQVVTDEKENRTIEVSITSVSPLQLIGGKAVGLIAVTLTQLVVWVVAVTVGLLIGAQFVPALQDMRVPWAFLGITLLYFLPAYVLMAGLMTAIGSAVTEIQQGQQIAGILNLLFVFPYFFTVLIFTNPNSPLMTALTLFPTTSLITITLRWGVTSIPFWQLAVSWLLLAATALFSVWAASRIFRTGMLRFGQQLSLRAAVQAVRGQGA